jgi:hypothetical protein
MVEQLSFSLFDYFPSQQQVVIPSATILNDEQDQGTIDVGTGRKTYAYDCGEELKGARKHLAAMAKFSVEWQKAIEEDPTQAFQLVCKDELLHDFIINQLREEGFTSQAAYAVKLILDRVCQRPDDDPKQREYFIQAIGELRMRLSTATNEQFFREVIIQLRDDFYKARYSTYSHKLESEPELINYRFWLSLGDRYKSLFTTRSRVRAGYHTLLEKAFSSEQGSDWNWMQKKGKGSNGSRKENVEKWERKVPEDVIRHSQEPSGVNRPEDLIELYGFRGIQFGNWVEDAAGRYHILCSGNALADLAAILELPRKAVSLYSSLGLAFGARGSGAAVAHYESGTNVMNITKIRGGGALCHEWAHALDFNLYTYSHNNTNGRRVALSGNAPGHYLPPDVISAFKELMKEIKEGEGCIRFAVPDPLPREEKAFVSGVVAYLKRYDYNVNAALVALKNSNYRISSKMWKDVGIMYCNILKREGMDVPTEFLIPTDESYFYLDAKERGPYWKRDHELFARAFEAWIEDELAERGMTNSYLVYGTRFSGPYPQGEERESINDAFRNWWKVLNGSGILHDDQLWN